MSRRRKNASAKQEFADLAARVMVFGVVIAVASLFIGNTLLGGAAKALLPLGLLLLASGGGLLWFSRGRSEAQTLPSALPPTRPPRTGHAPRDDVVDRTATELLREGAQRRPANAHREALTRWDPEVFAVIEWRRFEAVVERLFQQAGFETKSQSHGADRGVDVWLYSRNQPGQPVSLVQCKH